MMTRGMVCKNGACVADGDAGVSEPSKDASVDAPGFFIAGDDCTCRVGRAPVRGGFVLPLLGCLCLLAILRRSSCRRG